jgi:hypothetical protein
VANDCSFAVEVFVSRDDAEQALADALNDEPDWVSLLSVEIVESVIDWAASN